MTDRELARLIDRAYSSDLTHRDVEELLGSGDVQVAMSLAANEATPASSFWVIAQAFPEVAEIAARNPYAPAQLKDTLPLGCHTGFSIERYLEERTATLDQRIALLERYDSAPLDGGPLLGDAWSEIG